MIIALLWQPEDKWSQQVASCFPPDIMVLRPADSAEAEELLLAVPVDLIVVQAAHFTSRFQNLVGRLNELVPEALVVGVAPTEVIERARFVPGPAPQAWVDINGREREIQEAVRQAIQSVQLARQSSSALQAGDAVTTLQSQLSRTMPLAEAGSRRTPAENAWHKLISGVAAGADIERLLDVYVDAVAELMSCSSYCLLWRRATSDKSQEGYAFKVVRSLGLHEAVVRHARLLPTDGLPTWYRRQRRIITRAEVIQQDGGRNDLAARIGREMDLFGGSLAVPIMDSGHLWGILLIGEKVTGEPHTVSEVETVFVLSMQIGIAARQIELQRELARSSKLVDKVLQTMSSGVVVLGTDHKIAIYNDYAEKVLGIAAGEVIGRDLRCLPSPLGDLAYAALEDGQSVARERITLRGEAAGTEKERILEVTTSQLVDDNGGPLGGLVVFDDITAQEQFAEQKRRAEQLELVNNIVARLAQDIRTPLASVRTFAELLPERYNQADFREFWSGTVRKEIMKLNELISQMLALVQDPAEKRERIAPHQLLEHVLDRLADMDDVGWCQTEIREAGTVPDIVAEPNATCEALLYLLQMARGENNKWMEIEVGPAEVESSGGQLCISFRAAAELEGPQLSQLLDPLYVLTQPDADLRLAVSQRILQRQGGRIEVSNEPQGVYVKVYLPVAATQAEMIAEVK